MSLLLRLLGPPVAALAGLLIGGAASSGRDSEVVNEGALVGAGVGLVFGTIAPIVIDPVVAYQDQPAALPKPTARSPRVTLSPSGVAGTF